MYNSGIVISNNIYITKYDDAVDGEACDIVGGGEMRL